jgi:hypothetical protein
MTKMLSQYSIAADDIKAVLSENTNKQAVLLIDQNQFPISNATLR